MADNTDSQTAPPIGPAGGTSSDETYLERRTLRRGSAGPLLLTGLGVAYVVSGDFSGWNNGLAQGGFGGLAIAAVLMGLMYTCLVFALAELASIPVSYTHPGHLGRLSDRHRDPDRICAGARRDLHLHR